MVPIQGRENQKFGSVTPPSDVPPHSGRSILIDKDNNPEYITTGLDEAWYPVDAARDL
jgi:hypothetical protein